jgi:hypothetical protein
VQLDNQKREQEKNRTKKHFLSLSIKANADLKFYYNNYNIFTNKVKSWFDRQA